MEVPNCGPTRSWPDDVVRPAADGQWCFPRRLLGDEQLGANHCVMSCGHIGADLIALASILRIPVFMHNVPPEDLPTLGVERSAQIRKGATWRCAAYGPLYG